VLDSGSARPSLSQIGDVFGQPIDVDGMRVEVVGEPFLELAVALVARLALRRARTRNSP
jgi:hypothetical protein